VTVQYVYSLHIRIETWVKLKFPAC
jgi:hypothetical protein